MVLAVAEDAAEAAAEDPATILCSCGDALWSLRVRKGCAMQMFQQSGSLQKYFTRPQKQDRCPLMPPLQHPNATTLLILVIPSKDWGNVNLTMTTSPFSTQPHSSKYLFGVLPPLLCCTVLPWKRHGFVLMKYKVLKMCLVSIIFPIYPLTSPLSTHPGNCSANRLAPDMVSAVLHQLFLLFFLA